MKKIFIILIIGLSQACGYEGTDLTKYQVSILNYNQLPESVQSALVMNWEKASKADNNKDMLINLDSSYNSFNFENTAIVGLRSGAKIFEINNHKFYLKRDGNKEQPPFILKDGKIYFMYARNFEGMNLRSSDSLVNQIYHSYDLNSVLQ